MMQLGGVRSKLFVPGSRPELFVKAMAGAADALSFDLEDSVAPQQKAAARESVGSFLATAAPRKVCIVRVNSLNSGLLRADIERVVCPSLHVVNVPKVESRDDIDRVADALTEAEHRAGLSNQTSILANIETPRGLRLAYEIASGHPRVAGLQIGFVDMSAACNMNANNEAALNGVRLAVRLAATEAGVAAFDGAYASIRNIDGFRYECTTGRSFGMDGKSCIHPSQIAVVHEVFSPSTEEVERATRLIAEAEAQTAKGVGAFALDGEMVDAPVVARARTVLARVGHRPAEHHTSNEAA